MRPRIAPSTITALCLLACACMPACALAASNLPPQLVAKLEADRDDAQARLTAKRRELGVAVTKQQAAGARSTRLSSYADRLEPLLATIAIDVADTDLGNATRDADRAFDEADAALTEATDETSQAQAIALDSDRRLRALQRASATEDDRDTTLGSWRFGSGGPSVSAESIDQYLQSKGSPLAGQGAAFLEAGVEHEVDPRLVVAIAGAESYFGIHTCAPHNAWGWGCPTSPFAFKDWAHAIDTVTLGLREGYLDDGLDGVGEIHLRYAPPNASNDPNGLNYAWADNVARFLVEQGGDPEDVEGVLGPSR